MSRPLCGHMHWLSCESGGSTEGGCNLDLLVLALTPSCHHCPGKSRILMLQFGHLGHCAHTGWPREFHLPPQSGHVVESHLAFLEQLSCDYQFQVNSRRFGHNVGQRQCKVYTSDIRNVEIKLSTRVLNYDHSLLLIYV